MMLQLQCQYSRALLNPKAEAELRSVGHTALLVLWHVWSWCCLAGTRRMQYGNTFALVLGCCTCAVEFIDT